MNKKYALTLPINGVVEFKLTDRGLQYLSSWQDNNHKKVLFNNFLCDGKTYKLPFSDLLAVFPAAFVNLLFTLFISLSPSPLIAVYFLSALLKISVIAFDEIFNSFANS